MRRWPTASHSPPPIRIVEDTLDDKDQIIVGIPSWDGRIVLRAYPFRAPRLSNVTLPTTRLDPWLWALALLLQPCTWPRVPTWNIECFCCHSLTCPQNWASFRMLHEVAREVIFLQTYDELRRAKPPMPAMLTTDLLEYIVEVCVARPQLDNP